MKVRTSMCSDRPGRRWLRATQTSCLVACAVLTAIAIVAVPSSATAATSSAPAAQAAQMIGAPILDRSRAATVLTWSDPAHGIKAVGTWTAASSYGLTINGAGKVSVPPGESIRMTDGVAVFYQSSLPVGLVVMGDGTPVELTAAGTLTAQSSDRVHGGSRVLSPDFNCHCKFHWGIVSGTIYFNGQGTYELGFESEFFDALTVLLPAPWDAIFTLAEVYYQTMAVKAYSQGECVDVKTYGRAFIYLYPDTSAVPSTWCFNYD